MRITGVIALDAVGVADPVVYVRLEDTGRADAAARVVREQVLRPDQLEAPLLFELEIEDRAALGHYSIFVHVDVDHDGRISKGDYISRESYPAAMFVDETHHTIELRRVD